MHYRIKCLDSYTKGVFFEKLCYYYFTLGYYSEKVKSYHTQDGGFPIKIRVKFNLPKQDIGVDGIAELETGEWISIQAKFRADINSATPYSEISTFLGTTFSMTTNCKGISRGVLFTSSRIVNKKLLINNNISYIKWNDLCRLPEKFFTDITVLETQKLQECAPPLLPPDPILIENTTERNAIQKKMINDLEKFRYSPH